MSRFILLTIALVACAPPSTEPSVADEAQLQRGISDKEASDEELDRIGRYPVRQRGVTPVVRTILGGQEGEPVVGDDADGMWNDVDPANPAPDPPPPPPEVTDTSDTGLP